MATVYRQFVMEINSGKICCHRIHASVQALEYDTHTDCKRLSGPRDDSAYRLGSDFLPEFGHWLSIDPLEFRERTQPLRITFYFEFEVDFLERHTLQRRTVSQIVAVQQLQTRQRDALKRGEVGDRR